MNDFFLWGYIKSKIYGYKEIQNLEQLRQKIFNAFDTVTPDMLSNVRRGFYDRLGYCLMQEGGTFEQFL